MLPCKNIWVFLLNYFSCFVVFLTVASFLTILAKPLSFRWLSRKVDFNRLLAFSCMWVSVYLFCFLFRGNFFSYQWFCKSHKKFITKSSLFHRTCRDELRITKCICRIFFYFFFFCRYFTQHFSINSRALEHSAFLKGRVIPLRFKFGC